MSSKKMVLALSLSALVATISPTAAHAQKLTDGIPPTPLSIGSTFVETSTDFEIITAGGSIKCNKVIKDRIVIVNTTWFSWAGWNNLSGAEGCTITQNGAPVEITPFEGEDEYFEEGTGSSTLELVTHIAGVLTCTFSGTVPSSFTEGSAKVTIKGTLSGTGAGCATAAQVHATFQRETADTTLVIMD